MRNSFGAMRTSHSPPRKQCTPTSSLPCASPLCAHLHHWLPNRANFLAQKLARCASLSMLHRVLQLQPLPPCAQTALQATASSTPDGNHAGLQTGRSKKAGHCLQRLPDLLVHDAKFAACPVMCLGFWPAPRATCARTRECACRALALGLCHHKKKPMAECAVPMIALLMSKRSPHLPVCQRYNCSLSTAV